MVSMACVIFVEMEECRTDQKCYQVIPRSVLENAKGFAIFTIIKAGFLFSARAGSGIVIAKLEDGSEY
jgi:lipid-binding SYLF domain-containing protein